MRSITLELSIVLTFLTLISCSDTHTLTENTRSDGFERFRVKLEETIKVGMSQKEIIDQLGDPLIKRDLSEGKEVFIYRLDINELPPEDQKTYKEDFVDGATILFDSEEKVEQWKFSRGSISAS
ncbi:hypothetical protein [Pelagicoccus mobilis]|uniref:Uncharacterized protein n=1 Tax=Pelagicoccus mobilis TaxID=415221 RepID=A0A934VU40_9BACT|nr:hypothetical protein [Pelagicoccus mobilis]MBK1880715.1 hypothetical protein [Pelagicoccus mobilis]